MTARPAFLEPLERAAARDGAVLGHPLRAVPADFAPRRSAVLVLLAGTSLADAHLLLEERARTMRSQPGQFALPGGSAEPDDADDIATALRETAEETGLDPADVDVIGAFSAIPMPWRGFEVVPVAGWVPRALALSAVDPAEVGSVLWAPLSGPGSLTDTAVHRVATLDGRETGVAFDLPGDAFVWGFTAMIVDAVLGALDLPGPSPASRRVEVPALRRGAIR